MGKVKLNRFTIYKNDEKSALRLIEDMAEILNVNTDIAERSANILEWIEKSGLPIEVQKLFLDYYNNGQLESLINDTLLKNYDKLKNNSINYIFGTCPWISGTSEEKKREYIDTLEECKLKHFQLYITIVKKNGVYTTLETNEEILYLLSYAKGKGIKPFMLKFHQDGLTSSDFDENFIRNYIGQVQRIIELTKSFGYEYVTIFNEFSIIYNYPQYQNLCLMCINEVKRLGFKTSISVAGFNPRFKDGAYNFMLEEVKNNLDFICVNTYLKGIKTNEKVNWKENYNAMINETQSDFNYIINESNKRKQKIIISETGLMDYWVTLSAPSSFSVSDNPTVSNGLAPYVYMKCFFELTKQYQNNIIAAFWWFGSMYPYLELKELIKEEVFNE